jgi:hypothetical protein
MTATSTTTQDGDAMSYTTYDLSESLQRVSIARDDIASVRAAWGYSPERYGSWTGGFLLAMKDGSFAYVSGWCDTTGWGCQDGADVERFAEMPKLEALDSKVGSPKGRFDDEAPPAEWDIEPADLNRYVHGEITEHDRYI